MILTPSEQAKKQWQECKNGLVEFAAESNLGVLDILDEQATIVFTLSEFVANQCVRNPQAFIELINNNLLNQHQSFTELQTSLQSKLAASRSKQQTYTLLRQFRNQQMVAIYWRDLLELSTVKETCAQASALADVCIIEAHQWLFEHLCSEMEITTDDPFFDEQANHLLVMGMGKLGGNELNVSSDIDLIFSHPEHSHLKSTRQNFSSEKFYTQLGRELIQMLDKITEDGFVYRVDMRLRPYGDSGPLVMSFSAIEEYYQDQGRDWERFALIKARIITGGSAEKKLLSSLLKPFVFRRYIDFSVLESPRQMKRMIDQELRRRNLSNNIKLGAGGIREVEFIAQALQLIHGGRNTQLQCRSIFDSLPQLVEAQLLEKDTVDDLLECYLFLRKVEHRLQAYKDKQTQSLPSSEVEKTLLAEGLGFNDWLDFKTVLDQRMTNIHFHFNDQFQDKSQHNKNNEAQQHFDDIWQGFISDERTNSLDSELAGFENCSLITEQLESFIGSSAIRHMGPRGSQRLNQLMPFILQFVSTDSQQAVTLKRILRLLSSISRRTAYLELLAENQGALNLMLSLCSASLLIADQISDYPYVLDELINPNTLYHPVELTQYPDMLRQMLCRIPEDEPEQQLDCLREFRQINLLRITAADIAGAITVRQLSHHLSAIAETIISAVVNQSWQQVSSKHGQPQSSGFAIIAYGKLGGQELGYGSDLDLVFLHDAPKGVTDGDKPVENAVFFMRLAQKVIHLLNIRTRSGVLYEVDMRLRPSGNSGLLVSHIDSFIEYQNESAWTWEHQALIRSRCILGPVNLREQFELIRTQIICKARDESQLKEQVITMRAKMRESLIKPNSLSEHQFHLKQSPGGIADIEFITQFLVLKLASNNPALAISSNTSELLTFLASKDQLDDIRLKQMITFYAELLQMTNKNALQNRSNIVESTTLDGEKIENVIQLWNELLITN